jgi:hypothetical protein
MAIAHHPAVDERLLLLLWHMADRWGRVTPHGVSLSLRLTHELLADLIAVQRPSVTLSLQQLERQGRISREAARSSSSASRRSRTDGDEEGRRGASSGERPPEDLAGARRLTTCSARLPAERAQASAPPASG